MNRRSDVILYTVSALLLVGTASIWWQGVRPSPAKHSVVQPLEPGPGGADPSTAASPVSAPQEPREPPAIVVHVAGAVRDPGVYRLKSGQRLYEALALATPLADADLDLLNLASLLSDSQKVYVPRKGESLSSYPDDGPISAAPPVVTFPINLNSASQRELEELPGIGPVLAGAIIARRNEFGPFERAEDLKNVPGIGEKTYARIAPLVTVK